MERNQNGYPTMPKCGKAEAPRPDVNMPENRAVSPCTAIDSLPIGYAYVPRQKFRMLYNEEQALSHGTLFEELYLPVEVYAK